MKSYLNKFESIALLVLVAAMLAGCGGGDSAATPDTTAPTTTVAPAVSATTDTATTLSVTLDENGTGYYLVLPVADPAPAVAAVQAGTQFAMTANVAATPAISGLTFNTAYTIYFVAKDAANNVQAAVQSVPVTTSALPAGYVAQGGLVWMPVTFQDTWQNASAYCATTINGQTGWRQPTQAELSALYISGLMVGQSWMLDYTWSSELYITNYHYNTHMSTGFPNWTIDTLPNGVYVSCVR